MPAHAEDHVIVNRLLAATERLDLATAMGVLVCALVARAVGEGVPCGALIETIVECYVQREAQVAERGRAAS